MLCFFIFSRVVPDFFFIFLFYFSIFLSVLRKVNEMMRPLRIAREEEVTYVDANELLLQRGQHEWLAIMYYSDFIMDGASIESQNYTLMTSAFSGAAIDMKNNWPVVVSLKANAMSSYDTEPPTSVYGFKWGRGDSLMLGPSEKLPQHLPVLRLWWQGNLCTD